MKKSRRQHFDIAMCGMKTNKSLYRVETKIEGVKEPMVDWYEGETEAAALADWDEDCHRYGLPMDRITKTVREATEKERLYERSN